ncbi:MAG: hypothetical protein K4571_07885 [Deltaproteobacteria bacterium]
MAAPAGYHQPGHPGKEPVLIGGLLNDHASQAALCHIRLPEFSFTFF